MYAEQMLYESEGKKNVYKIIPFFKISAASEMKILLTWHIYIHIYEFELQD